MYELRPEDNRRNFEPILTKFSADIPLVSFKWNRMQNIYILLFSHTSTQIWVFNGGIGRLLKAGFLYYKILVDFYGTFFIVM